MENIDNSNKGNNKATTIIIILLLLIVIMLGFYFISNEFLNNDNENKNNEISCTNTDSSTKDEENDGANTEVKYEFIENRINNSDNNFTYTLDKTIYDIDSFKFSKNNNGYDFCLEDTTICESIDGSFSSIAEGIIYKHAAGLEASYVFLISENGDLYYVHLGYDDSKKEDTVEIVNVSQLKNVVKLYNVNLVGDSSYSSSNGHTVVAQTEDGSLYDIYSYILSE